MSLRLNPTQCQLLKRAWHDFNTVINTLPASETTTLLIFHTHNLLNVLGSPLVDLDYVEAVTQRVNQLVKTSATVLDIDDMLTLINTALARLSTTDK